MTDDSLRLFQPDDGGCLGNAELLADPIKGNLIPIGKGSIVADQLPPSGIVRNGKVDFPLGHQDRRP